MQYLAVPEPDVTSPLDMDHRQARIVLSMIVEPADPHIRAMIEEYGPVQTLHRLTDPNYYDDHAEPKRFRMPEQNEVTNTFRILEVLQIETVIPGDPEWPEQLDDLDEPPLLLYVRGSVEQLRTDCIGFVGSRAATAYGVQATNMLVEGVADRAWTIVSGGAFGIDVTAHSAALGITGATIAVLAGGLDRYQPDGNAEVFRRIFESPNGALVSEVPPFRRPTRYRFMARNRIIAALSRVLVVVEAGIASGTLNSARHALRLDRPVGVVPGPITSVASKGANALLGDPRVKPVQSSGDILNLAS